MLATLAERARSLPGRAEQMRYVVCARSEVTGADGALAVTAADIWTEEP